MRVEVRRKGDPIKVAGDVYENAKVVIKSYSNTDILIVKCINGATINYNLTEIAWWTEKPQMEEEL